MVLAERYCTVSPQKCAGLLKVERVVVVPDDDITELLKRAREAFSLAGKLGRAFYDESQSRASFYDASGWDRHAASFEELWNVLLGLREAMQHPPDGFEKVAEQLNEAARVAKRMRAAIRPKQDPASWPGTAMGFAFGLKNPGPPKFTGYMEFFPELNTVCERGFEAIKHATNAQKLDDPFAFVDEVKSEDGADFTLVDRYPNTMEGHVRFIEFVSSPE